MLSHNKHAGIFSLKENHPSVIPATKRIPTINQSNTKTEASPLYKPRSLMFMPNERDLNRLHKCVVGVLHDPSQLGNLEEQLVEMGVQNCSIKPMGGNFVLFEFPSMQEIQNMM